MTLEEYNSEIALNPIEGFDCNSSVPNILVFRPNSSRSLEQKVSHFGRAVFLGIFISPFLYFFLNFIGVLHDKMEGPKDPASIIMASTMCGVIVLAIGAILCLEIYCLVSDEIIRGKTPITLDFRNDQLRYGSATVCKLSEIKRIVLRRIDMAGDARSSKGDPRPRYGVSLQLKNGRTIPKKLLPAPSLRFWLGPQDLAIEQSILCVAELVRSELRLEKECWTGPGKGM